MRMLKCHLGPGKHGESWPLSLVFCHLTRASASPGEMATCCFGQSFHSPFLAREACLNISATPRTIRNTTAVALLRPLSFWFSEICFKPAVIPPQDLQLSLMAVTHTNKHHHTHRDTMNCHIPTGRTENKYTYTHALHYTTHYITLHSITLHLHSIPFHYIHTHTLHTYIHT